jgi:hypothetical protein
MRLILRTVTVPPTSNTSEEHVVRTEKAENTQLQKSQHN